MSTAPHVEQPAVTPGPTPARPYFRHTVGLEGNKIHEVKHLGSPQVLFSSRFDFSADLVRDLLNGEANAGLTSWSVINETMRDLRLLVNGPLSPESAISLILAEVRARNVDFFTAPAAPEINADGNAGKDVAKDEPRAPYVGIGRPKMPPCDHVNCNLSWVKDCMETALRQVIKFCCGELKRTGKPFGVEGMAQLSLAAVPMPLVRTGPGGAFTKDYTPDVASANATATEIVTQANERLVNEIVEEAVNECLATADIRQCVVKAICRLDAARRGQATNLSPSAKSA